MTRLGCLVAGTALALLVRPVLAQEAKTDTEVVKGLGGVPSESSFSLPVPAIILSASETEKKAVARFGLEHRDLLIDLQLSTPIDEPDTFVEPVSLDGLANHAALAFSLGYLRWRAKPNVPELQKLCQEAVQANDCDDDQIAPEKRAEWDRHFHYSRTAAVFSARARVAHNEFRWLDRTTLAPGEEKHTDYSLGAMVGLFNPSIGFLAAHFDQQEFYQAGRATQLCRPLGATGGSTCSNVVLSAPAKASPGVVRLEWRKFLGRGNIAINPVFSRDLEDKVSSIQVPIYFLSDANGGLNGGVSFGWRSDQDTFLASVFVGPSLKLITSP
jgi:hypothetical protein